MRNCTYAFIFTALVVSSSAASQAQPKKPSATTALTTAKKIGQRQNSQDLLSVAKPFRRINRRVESRLQNRIESRLLSKDVGATFQEAVDASRNAFRIRAGE